MLKCASSKNGTILALSYMHESDDIRVMKSSFSLLLLKHPPLSKLPHYFIGNSQLSNTVCTELSRVFFYLLDHFSTRVCCLQNKAFGLDFGVGVSRKTIALLSSSLESRRKLSWLYANALWKCREKENGLPFSKVIFVDFWIPAKWSKGKRKRWPEKSGEFFRWLNH